MAEMTKQAREKVLKYLEEKGYSHATVATLFGLTPPKLSNILSGKDSSRTAIETLSKIIEAYGIR